MSGSKQYILLDTYSKMIGLHNSVESDLAKCAAEYIKLSGSLGDSFLSGVLHRAKMYMTSDFNEVDAGTKDATPGGSAMSLRTDDGEYNSFADYYIDCKNDKEVLNVFCEGTSTGIGTSNAHSGCGIYALYTDSSGEQKELKKKYVLSGGDPVSNQRAELSAFYAGLDILNKIKEENPNLTKYYIHITSKYAYNCVSEWGPVWASKKWKRSEGAIKNVDIIRPLFEKLQKMSFVQITVFQKDKSKKGDANVAPEWFLIARDMALQAITVAKSQQNQNSDSVDIGNKDMNSGFNS